MSNVKVKSGPETVRNAQPSDAEIASNLAVAGNDWYKTNGLPREAHLVMPGGPSMTRQEFADECDINSIMKRYEGHLADPMRSIREPMYFDFTQAPSTLMDAMNIMNEGRDAFMLLPATVRREFDNDPAMFVDFAGNPDNLEQMREWGLAPPAPPPVEPMAVRVIPDPPVEGAPAASPAPAASAKA